MNKLFQAFAYVILIVVGGIMIGFTIDGHVIKMCIACNSVIGNIAGIVSIFTGFAGLIGTIAKKDMAVNDR